MTPKTLRLLFVAVLLALGACASPVEAYCAAQAACDRLGNKSEAQCAADRQKMVDDARKKPKCESLADAYERMLACESALSCTELKLSTNESACKQEIEAFAGSAIHNLGCAFN